MKKLVVCQGNSAGFMVRKSSFFPPLLPLLPLPPLPAFTRHLWVGRVLEGKIAVLTGASGETLHIAGGSH